MPKPSELQEDEWITITPRNKTGRIGFHLHYGQLSCFAMNAGSKVQTNNGIEFTNDPSLADKIYAQYQNNPEVVIEHGRTY